VPLGNDRIRHQGGGGAAAPAAGCTLSGARAVARQRPGPRLEDADQCVKSWEGYELRLVSPNIDPALTRGAPNVEIVCPGTNEQLMALYDWADVVALAIKPNLHASGITVIEEATICGVPSSALTPVACGPISRTMR